MPFTPQAASEMLGIPPSTLRRYSVDFADVLSETANRAGKKRKYTEQDIMTLRKIRNLTKQRLDPADIRARLQVIEPEPEPNPQSAIMLVPEIMHEFENLRAAILQAHETMQRMQDRIDALEHEQSRPWYQKLLGKK